MATFGELITKVSSRLQDDSNTAVSSSIVGDSINDAIKYYKKTAFWFNQGESTLTLTVGDPVLPASGLFSIRSMRLPYQNMTYDLRALQTNEYDWSNLEFNGRPFGYVYRSGSYQLYYYPDQAYTVIVSGLKDYAPLVNAEDSNDFTVNADQMILYDALSRLHAELRTDPTMSDYYTKRSNDEKSGLTTETNRRMATGRAGVYETFTNRNYIGDYETCW